MSAYYRDHLTFPNLLYPGDTIANTPRVDANDAHVVDGVQPATDVTQYHSSGPARLCSVRGCGSELPNDYAHKMCETCRGRHRVYANTKRAKRKMEKAAMGLQNGHVVWMPPDDTTEDDGGDAGHHQSQLPPLLQPQSQQAGASVVPRDRVPGSDEPRTPSASAASTQFPFSDPSWDHAIDPRLFSQTSELAGALILPTSTSSLEAHAVQQQHHEQQQQEQPSAASPDSASQSSSRFPSVVDGSLPPRFCSIKGCKALVPANSFFRMCSPCRDRYRNYGTTKRAKWKREKEVAVAELQQMRTEEEKRRADAGLPPLPERDVEWREYQADGLGVNQAASTSAPDAGGEVLHAPRMCTVSHCREILPGGYQYLRCERHRIQNRHHSKLKRVRDKEVKAQAYDGWAAAVSGRSGDDAEFSKEGSEGTFDTSMEMAMEHTPEVDAEDAAQRMGTPADTPLGEPSTGIPPAARGSRRTNHVCSIKACFNLLSPSNPWKMCDSCRARDRAIRRYKALRDSGIFVEPPPEIKQIKERRKRGEGRDTAKKIKSKKKKKNAVVSTKQSSTGETSSMIAGAEPGAASSTQPDVAREAQADFDLDVPGHLVFIDPLLPGPAEERTNAVSMSSTSVAPATDTGAAASSAAAPQEPLPEATASRTAPSEAAPRARKKRMKRKDKVAELINKTASTVPAVPGGTDSAAPTVPSSNTDPLAASTSMVPPQPGVSSDASAPAAPSADANGNSEPNQNGAYLAPSYHMPYYIPPPYNMQPYPAGSSSPPYPYSAAYSYMRPPYGPSPMYQVPYPPYGPPYPYPPQPYTQPYPPRSYVTSPPPPDPPTPNQPLFSVSSTFVSRAEYAAQNTHTNTTSYTAAAEAASYYSTFSARTGEPHHRAPHAPSLLRRKRALDAQNVAAEASKRQVVEAAGNEGVPSSVPIVAPSVPNTPAVAAPPPAEISDNLPSVVDPVPPDNNQLVEPANAIVLTCSNKTCHRIVPANNVGTLCARCKERMKKRQIKAKHRFKLEPRKFLGRPSDGSGTEQVAHVGGERGDAGDE
ncbi:hypothetical protein SCP_1500190 [Sparassis crispa]|uniref:Uncharacterized protein n=1 Tax=Sparassis crispa TaxID=139825 RepID=A0A401H3K9_9APHY|nr:hypothetical protein SCP_1500190 [Sparassis crispa]GBE89017.1 hypothetical protein SCP_1500190 [Sparassis crispa]